MSAASVSGSFLNKVYISILIQEPFVYHTRETATGFSYGVLLNPRHEKSPFLIVLNPQKNKDAKAFVICDDVTSRDSLFEDNIKSSISKFNLCLCKNTGHAEG